MIEVAHLSKRFGRNRVVDDLSFRVPEGEAVALWGENGAGKTTIIRCILGLLPFRGAIAVAGRDVRREGKSARQAIGYVPQELALYDDLRVVEALAFFARLKRAPTDRAAGVLAEVSLQAHRRKRIRQLSGGMKQRLALAIALLTDPPLLVLDELTSNLDAAAQSGFMSLLRRLKSRGKTILFTSHHLGEIEFLAERVIVLDPGGKKRECTPESLAHTIGARCELKVFVAADAVSDAVEALRREGFAVTPNGRRVHVAVSPREKAGPIQALTRAGIAVMDFDLLEGAASRAFGEGDADG